MEQKGKIRGVKMEMIRKGTNRNKVKQCSEYFSLGRKWIMWGRHVSTPSQVLKCLYRFTQNSTFRRISIEYLPSNNKTCCKHHGKWWRDKGQSLPDIDFFNVERVNEISDSKNATQSFWRFSVVYVSLQAPSRPIRTKEQIHVVLSLNLEWTNKSTPKISPHSIDGMTLSVLLVMI